MEFDVLPNRMSGCAIAVHWHLGLELHMASNASCSDTFVLFVCFVVNRSPRPAWLPWEHSATVANKSVQRSGGRRFLGVCCLWPPPGDLGRYADRAASHGLLRETFSVDAVLFFQVGNLTGQILAGDGRQQAEERMQHAAHCGLVIRRLNVQKVSGNPSFLTPLEGWPKYPDSAPVPTAMKPPMLGTARLVRR